MASRARQYVIRVDTEFAAAHVLRGYAGACERIHGHTWKVSAEVVARELDELGMGIDTVELRRALSTITDELDHRLLNEVSPFCEVNPTAENVASFIYARLVRTLQAHKGGRVRLRSITVSEDDRSAVTYSELEG
ncbi:MAG: 6-carboxytetrahydropterin synthase QueD [Nannocystaceae bacterium]|nr:6-carboxytetrahydropterin synthase QueD [Nannocystaceae bacterium]